MKAFLARRVPNSFAQRRLLTVESLEDRRLLAGSPWQNPALRLDVTKDGQVTPNDASQIVNRLISFGAGFLAQPNPNPPQFYYDTSGDNILSPFDLLKVVNYLQAPPTAELTSLAPFTIDVTPQVTYKVTGAYPPNGTIVALDADLNDDGDFDDPGELNRGQGSLYNGASTFTMSTPLERSESIYKINLRARTTTGDAPLSATLAMDVDTRTNTVLEDYVNAADPAYQYTMVSKTTNMSAFGPYTHYVLNMTSQTWRSAEEVNKPTWNHWVEIYQPAFVTNSTAILLINGGSNTDGAPAPTDEFALAAIFSGAVMVHLRGVPNEPVIFADEPGKQRTEDEIIAYSFDKFLDNVDLENPNDPDVNTWPLLIAMTKAAVRTMDTAQDFMAGGEGKATVAAPINDFLVTGYSKRGWTTWLTAAVDDRVRAIIPGVFDNLNQGEQMAHHYGVYGFFSEAVHDYNDLEIFHRILTPEALELSQITDPYRYLNNGRFDDMPKLVMNSAGDEFFVSDSSQFYFHDLPGTQNYLRYIPNVGHGMGLSDGNTTTLESTVAFYDAIVNNDPLPQFSWTIAPDGTIQVHTDTTPIAVNLWEITNPNARDFRRAATPNLDWTSTPLSQQGSGNYSANVEVPGSGARAYFIELTFASNSFFPHIFTTDINVKAVTPWHPWPFESGLGSASQSAGGLEGMYIGDAPAGQVISTGLVMSANPANAPIFGSLTYILSTPLEVDPLDMPLPIVATIVAPQFGGSVHDDAEDTNDQVASEAADSDEWADYLVDDELLALLS